MPKMFGQLLLYSFERAGKALEESGDDACVEPPVPIPNTAVKHARAEGTWLETAWENRSLPVYFMAGVVKWLTHWIVAPACMGSIPITRPIVKIGCQGMFYLFDSHNRGIAQLVE